VVSQAKKNGLSLEGSSCGPGNRLEAYPTLRRRGVAAGTQMG